MLKELLSKLTTGEVKYAFEKKAYTNPDNVKELAQWMDWFSETELYGYLCDYCETDEYFEGFMICASLLGIMGIRQSRERELQKTIEEISDIFATREHYAEHQEDCVYELLASMDNDGCRLLRLKIRKASALTGNGFWDALQIINAYYFFLVSPESFVDNDEDIEGEVVEEEEESWPELIG